MSNDQQTADCALVGTNCGAGPAAQPLGSASSRYDAPMCSVTGDHAIQTLGGDVAAQARYTLEPDGLCHVRSGGTVEPLVGDVLQGDQAGFPAFLAVGVALLRWPRLRAAQ